MMDMLVRLYDLPDIEEDLRRLEREGFLIRRPGAYERHLVADWVGRNFSPKWVSEAKVVFGRQPISCYIATREKKILGFACYDVTARGFLGPMGVAEEVRRSGLGKQYPASDQPDMQGAWFICAGAGNSKAVY